MTHRGVCSFTSYQLLLQAAVDDVHIFGGLSSADKMRDMTLDTSLMKLPPNTRTWEYAKVLCQQSSNLYENEAKRMEAIGTALDNLFDMRVHPANISNGVLSYKIQRTAFLNQPVHAAQQELLLRLQC
jgi:hypothetical protein